MDTTKDHHLYCILVDKKAGYKVASKWRCHYLGKRRGGRREDDYNYIFKAAPFYLFAELKELRINTHVWIRYGPLKSQEEIDAIRLRRKERYEKERAIKSKKSTEEALLTIP